MARKKSDTWMPIYIGDYLADTMRLTTLQHGAYFLLLMEYWRQGPLPDDMDELCAVCRSDRKAWDKLIWPTLRRFFERQEDGFLHQKRADGERANASEKKVKRSEAAHARWGEKRSKRDASAYDMHKQSICKGDDTQSSPLPSSSLRSEEPSLRSGGASDDAAPAQPKSKRGCRLPKDWEPSAELAAFARENQVDPHATAEKFRDYWHGVPGSRGVKLDWDATFRNWVRREDGWKPGQTTPNKSQQRAENVAAWGSGVMLPGY